MTTDTRTLTVAGLRVEVVRKAIKNLHLGVYPPDGRVRVAAPLALSAAAIRVAVISRLPWIRRHQAGFHQQPRESPRELVSGESHHYRGRRYRLEVIAGSGRPRVEVHRRRLRLFVREGASVADREALLERWYRARLRELLAPLVAQWQTDLGVDVRQWGVKRMKTKWGSCNPRSRRVWFNLELAKKSPEALEYVVVHELLHLRVPTHDDRFVALMHRHLPPWPRRRAELNATALAAQDW